MYVTLNELSSIQTFRINYMFSYHNSRQPNHCEKRASIASDVDSNVHNAHSVMFGSRKGCSG